ncbi:hypothetical protein EDB80DRAFT_752285 [Ilyonectria destructans]|nr:hypothetical protein EDB80DRAFT_752285 [Ilyonectria destructans]
MKDLQVNRKAVEVGGPLRLYPTKISHNAAQLQLQAARPLLGNRTRPLTAMPSLAYPLTSFTAEDGNVYELSPDAPLWRNLGKKVLILDVDSRLDTSKGAMLNPDKPTRKTMNKRTGGILNHMLYALMHGYDYRLVRPPSYEDRHGTWVKVPAIKEALKTHDIVVFLDADAIFHYIDLPLEWLMGHWNITTNTLLAAPIDIEEEVNYDSQGQLYWNTGFVIARQSELTQEMFTKWEACPTEEEYEGCSRWLEEWAHEQAAFGNHIRYDYNTDGHLTPIPCNEANGSPDPRGNCRGVFIRHYWHSKEYVVDELYEQISSETVETLHRMFHNDLDQFFVDGSNLTYPLFNGDLVI